MSKHKVVIVMGNDLVQEAWATTSDLEVLLVHSGSSSGEIHRVDLIEPVDDRNQVDLLYKNHHKEKGHKNPWGTKEWKALREKLLKGFCEQCGATDGGFVLQHMWHPPSMSQVLRETALSLGMKQDEPHVVYKAQEIYKKNHERYMSGKDTVTFCKKCAFLWDKHGLKLCERCRENYHSQDYIVCKQCAHREREQERYGIDLFEGLTGG